MAFSLFLMKFIVFAGIFFEVFENLSNFAHVIKLNNYEEMPTVMAPARCMTRRAKPTGAIMPSAMAAILSKLGER